MQYNIVVCKERWVVIGLFLFNLYNMHVVVPGACMPEIIIYVYVILWWSYIIIVIETGIYNNRIVLLEDYSLYFIFHSDSEHNYISWFWAIVNCSAVNDCSFTLLSHSTITSLQEFDSTLNSTLACMNICQWMSPWWY